MSQTITRYYLEGPRGYVSRTNDWTPLFEDAHYWVTSEAACAALRRWQHIHSDALTVLSVTTTRP